MNLRNLPAFPIVPTQRAAWLIAGFAPIALVIAAMQPGLWIAAPVAAAALIALVLFDALLAGKCADWRVFIPCLLYTSPSPRDS